MGLTLLGLSLILGIFVRLSSFLGVALIWLAGLQAGKIWGLENWCANLSICSKFPKLRDWLA